jgi:hypothetical protein
MTLSEEDTYRYLQHRLTVAQYEGSSLFTREAQKLIWEFSGGIPRKINILCDNALLIGYGLERKDIDSEIIKEAINDLSWSPYINAAASQGPSPAVNEETMPAHEQADISQEAKPPDEAEEDSIPQGIRFADGEEIASLPAEIPSFEPLEYLKGAPKPRLDRRQSSLIAGVLILVCLIIIVWFFFTKPKVNLGENISLRSQTKVQNESIDSLKRSPYKFPVQVKAFSSVRLINRMN